MMMMMVALNYKISRLTAHEVSKTLISSVLDTVLTQFNLVRISKTHHRHSHRLCHFTACSGSKYRICLSVKSYCRISLQLISLLSILMVLLGLPLALRKLSSPKLCIIFLFSQSKPSSQSMAADNLKRHETYLWILESTVPTMQ